MKPNILLACRKSPFFTGKNGSRTIAPEEIYPPTLALTLKLTQTLTLIGRGGQFSLGGNREIIKNKRGKKKIKPKRLCFIKLNKIFRKVEL